MSCWRRREHSQAGNRWRGGSLGCQVATPGGRSYMRTFRTKREAERFHASELTDRSRGAWIDPGGGRLTFSERAEEWYQAAAARWRARTAEKHAIALRVHWTPRLGGLVLTAITPRQFQAAVNELTATHENSRAGECAHVLRDIAGVFGRCGGDGSHRPVTVSRRQAPEEHPRRAAGGDTG